MINIFNSNSIQKNKCESWREDISFPANLELGYCVVTARGNIILGYEAAKKAAEIWQPISSTGIGTINSNVLLPAICVPEFKDVVLRRYRSRVHIVIIILS